MESVLLESLSSLMVGPDNRSQRADHSVPSHMVAVLSPKLASGQTAQHQTPLRNIYHSFHQQPIHQQRKQVPSSVTSTQPCLLRLSTTLTTTATLVAGRSLPLQVVIAFNRVHRASYLRVLQYLHSNSAVARSNSACLALSTSALTRVLYRQRASHMARPSAWDRLLCFIF